MSSERAEAPLPQACPPPPLSSPEIPEVLVALRPPAPISRRPWCLGFWAASCPQPMLYGHQDPVGSAALSPERELSTRAPPARLPGARPPARGSRAQSIKAWAARQQEAAAGLHPHSDPDSHWNPAKLLSRAPCGQGRSPGTTASHPEGHLRRGVWRGSGKWSRY